MRWMPLIIIEDQVLRDGDTLGVLDRYRSSSGKIWLLPSIDRPVLLRSAEHPEEDLYTYFVQN